MLAGWKIFGFFISCMLLPGVCAYIGLSEDIGGGNAIVGVFVVAIICATLNGFIQLYIRRIEDETNGWGK